MSSTRRAASEVNILAMLDRQEGGALPQRFLRGLLNRSRMFWYGAAGVLVCALVGSLAWLARDTGASSAVDTALAGAVTSAGGRVTGLAAAPPDPAASASGADAAPYLSSTSASDAGPESAPIGGATIVNLAPAQPGEPSQTLMHQPPARTPARTPAPKPAPKPAPQEHPGRITAREARPDPQRLAAHAAAPKAAVRTPAPGKPPVPVRSRRQPPPAKAAPGAVDTDVALISAIIQHASKHQEAEDAACAAPPCPPRTPAKP
jgi:hypothetical protein